MAYKVKDTKLAEKGKLQIEWAEKEMPVLMQIRREFEKTKPFNGLTIGVCLHNTKETAVLVRTLKAGGANIALCAANPLSTQDDVAAALAQEDINIFSWSGETNEEYYDNVNKILDFKPQITIDDGADLVTTLHTKRTELIGNVFGGQEETTTGVIRLRAMTRDGKLRYPVVAINDAHTKHLFDNMYGTAQSTLDGILRATSILLAGKNFVVIGYGHCGSELARKAEGMGANVIVCEVDAIKALKAAMDGFRVMTTMDAAKVGDVFVTVTGNKNVLRKEHFEVMKEGAILANTGHFNVEINVMQLKESAKSKRQIRENVEEYVLNNGRKVYLLGQGRIINLVAAEGHPSSVMDMSFANQALCAEWLAKNYKNLEAKVYDVPKDIDNRIARLKLETMGISIDKLSSEQENYLTTWEEGT